MGTTKKCRSLEHKPPSASEPVTTFAVYADCAVEMRPGVDEQVRFAEELPDPDACVWLGGAGEAVVMASFDLSATDFDGAVVRGRKAVEEALGRAGLAGMVVVLTAMTEDGQARWTADDAEDEFSQPLRNAASCPAAP